MSESEQIAFEGDDIPLEKLPRPNGWFILVAPVLIKEVTSGGLILTEETTKAARYFANVAKVLAVGDLCYQKDSFNPGVPVQQRAPKPWCKAGDIVLISSFTGLEISLMHNGKRSKLKLIADDEVTAVIPDLSLFNPY